MPKSRQSEDPSKLWNPTPRPITPKAKKPTGRHNPRQEEALTSGPFTARSQALTPQFADSDKELFHTEAGFQAFLEIAEDSSDVDMAQLRGIEERVPGDIDKIMLVFEALAMGARHRDALSQVDWTWSHISIYRNKVPAVGALYNRCVKIGEEMRKAYRLDEAHRRAVDGVEEDIFAPNGRHVGTKMKYSDALLTLLLKADDPDKFSERHEVKQTGVILNMQMGLRENVKTEAMTQGEIKVESPFADDKKEDLPEGN